MITIKHTANPAILKFETDHFLVSKGSYEFNNIDEAKQSPLAKQLFHLPFVKKIYIASNFIAIERYNIVEWSDVQSEVAEQLEAYIRSGSSIIDEAVGANNTIAVTFYAESTPNPAVLKFVCNKLLVTDICEFSNIEEAKNSPLATELFKLPFVKNVFLDKNYVSITKYDIVSWDEITMTLREFLKDFIEQGKSVVTSYNKKPEGNNRMDSQDKVEKQLDPISQQIITILEEHVRPAVASDGGNIEFKGYDADSKQVEVLLQGACSGCPSSTFTLKNGIENMLKSMLNDPNISVSAVNN